MTRKARPRLTDIRGVRLSFVASESARDLPPTLWASVQLTRVAGLAGLNKEVEDESRTDEEYRAEASTYIAYSGEFHVDEEKKTLTHSMFVSLFPNWIGQTQPRVVKIEGDSLHLSTASPILSKGKLVNSYLQWKRAGDK